jgi:ATP-binding cassette, subfamily B, bacterial
MPNLDSSGYPVQPPSTRDFATGANLRRIPRLLISSLRLVWQAGHREFAIATSLQLLSGAATGLQLLVIQGLIAAVLSGQGPGSSSMIVLRLVEMVGLSAFTSLAGSFQSQQQQVLAELVSRRAARPVMRVATSIDLRTFETSDFHDRLMRAEATATARPLMAVAALIGLVRSGSTLVGIGIALFLLSPLLVVLVITGLIPLWLLTTATSKAFYRYMRSITPSDRKLRYIIRLLTSQEYAKEVRTFGLGEFFTEKAEALSIERLHALKRHLGTRLRISVLASLTLAAIYAFSFASLAYLVSNHAIAISAAGAAAAGIMQLGMQLNSLTTAGAMLYESSLFIEDLTSFLALMPQHPPGPPNAIRLSDFRVVELRDVHFAYPTSGQMLDGMGTRPYALKGVSLTIPRGQIVALVGENGSGKTTLAKVLCGLYQPERGSITWDGFDVTKVPPQQLRENVTAIFQDFACYDFTASENIRLGRVDATHRAESIVQAARMAGAHEIISALPNGYQTMLGSLFEGGEQLSIGQWQRVALARAFYRDAPLIILDEPTASLDPRAEYDLFERIRLLFAGRTIVLISHRFSSVRSADHIYVLKDGSVVDHGTHQELITARGLYHDLFTLQASAYIDKARRP